ncbi:glucose-1-phosphate cytidylyltransferase [Sedimentibacter sp.]|uniref:glucose-1-phosphate cytidylyltransferase n=1 Tax=Sedimentibacter sp. TaxID=1960295 RepID=UPI0028A122E7|nr:glucose-1-phosphate cytidylyltransferase [Sedimentibacter sp.]
MKVVILAGGFGTRISEESHLKPKPMIEIGGNPILWHIMKIYSHYGFNEFIICCGYKGYLIKEYFADYYLHRSDITFDFSKNNEMIVHSNVAEPWRVTVMDTGLNTQTGGRLKRVQKFIENETFMLTYGDGVSNVNINELVSFHQKNKKTATITAVQPGGKFGVLEIDGNQNITRFAEKSKEDGGWVNGGFMVLEPDIFDLIEDNSTILERDPLEKLTQKGELFAYKHSGFWQCMDTQRDKNYLESIWEKNMAPWKVWEI